MQVNGANAVVVGLGKSGQAAVRLLLAKGAHVTANDARDAQVLGPVASGLLQAGAQLELGHHPAELFQNADVVVVSPGVPRLPVLMQAHAKGVTVASEVEFASWFIDADIIGITGTNGKSTVTTLVGQMCQSLPCPVFVGGNLGTPLTDVVDTAAARKGAKVVVELSSFQLEWLQRFRAHIAVLLNITPDHLDRYRDLNEYAAYKGEIFRRQTPGDHAVVPADDGLCQSFVNLGQATPHLFSVSDIKVQATDIGIKGVHNLFNAAAACVTARLCGVPEHNIEQVLGEFKGLPHRMQAVATVQRVTFYDDSKATNEGAAVAAIDGLQGLADRVVLIAGGVHKGTDYRELAQRMAQHGRAAVLIGQAAPLLREAFKDTGCVIELAHTMQQAVSAAHALARPGDAVLLAPACASFDMFESYAHRGQMFQRAVNQLNPAGVL